MSDIKGASTIELTRTIKGYGAAQETVDLLNQNKSIVGHTLNPHLNYYLYYWLLTSGKYVCSADDRCFHPVEGARPENYDELQKNANIAADRTDIGRVSGSWGLSMDTLRNVFSTVDVDAVKNQIDSVQIDLQLSEKVNGNDVDFVYLEFDGMDKNYEYYLFNHASNFFPDMKEGSSVAWLKKALFKKNYNPGVTVRISYLDDEGVSHNMSCMMDQGKLLIPLGINRGWLLNEHDHISICVYANGEPIDIPVISNFEFLKLREVQ